MNRRKQEKEIPLLIPILLIVVLVGIVIYGVYNYFKNKADLPDDTEPTVVENDSNNVVLSFDKSRYSCVEGETFEVKIYTSENAGEIAAYSSTKDEVVTLETGNASDAYCVGCTVAKVECKSVGTAEIKVTTDNDYKATANISVLSSEVETDESKILFDKSSYACKVGEKLNARITVLGEDVNKVTYSSSDKNIATIDKKSINGENINVQITCKKDGNVTLNAKTEKGLETESSVIVKLATAQSGGQNQSTSPSEGTTIDQSIGSGTITFDQSSFSCEEGEKLTTTITAGGSLNSRVESYTSSNTSIATIEKHPTISVKCMNCIAVQITCKKAGDVTLTAKSNEGVQTTAKVKVKSVEEQIFFNKTDYTCKAGEKISATITALGNFRTKVPAVESFKSENEEIAGIIKHPDYNIKCMNCIAVQINCNKAGTTALSAVSTTGAKGRATVTVTEAEKAKISFDKSSYTCVAGEKIDTTITAIGSGDKVETVASYTSSNTAVATIEKNPDISIKCINCLAVRITCKKSGSVTLTAKSSSGAKGTSTVKVTAPKQNTVTFDKTSYACHVGEQITTQVRVNNNSNNIETIKSYTSSNTDVATIVKHPTLAVNCINCVVVQITCKGAGTATLTAKASGGTTGTSSIKVSPTAEKVAFEKTKYTCNPGDKITTTIKTTGVFGARIASYTSSDTNIASVEKHPTLAVDCVNCVAVQITCKKSGNVTLTAKSSTGAKGTSTVSVMGTTPKVSYEKSSYNCTPGEQITTLVRAEGSVGARVTGYTSNNPNVATVEKHPTLAVECINCVAVQITCKSAGTATLSATSSDGAKGTASVSVSGSTTKVYYEKSSYACTPGQKITTLVKTEGNYAAHVASYTSNNPNVATVEKHPTLAVDCVNCVAVQITCKSAGTATLSATSSDGAKGSSTVSVTSGVPVEKISFDKMGYSCKVGDKITATITAEGSEASRVESYSSGDTTIATIVKHPTITPKCINCEMVEIACKKVGMTTVTATSNKRAKMTVTVNVTE